MTHLVFVEQIVILSRLRRILTMFIYGTLKPRSPLPLVQKQCTQRIVEVRFYLGIYVWCVKLANKLKYNATKYIV